jgi:rubrerythrin
MKMSEGAQSIQVHEAAEPQPMAALMGLAVFGEKVAARTYLAMAGLRPEMAPLMRKFASMEARHGTSFAAASRDNDVEPDRAFADRELGYLLAQVEEYAAASDFDALAVLQGFIVESLAIATYEPFLAIADRYRGAKEAFATALADERYHVDWITRYLRLRYFDAVPDLLGLAERVNARGIDCVGGTMMNIARYLDTVGLSGADCAAGMMDGYTELLEHVGLDQRAALRNVAGIFAPLMAKYRRGERTK